jgi:hypothetical protein
MAIVMKHGLYTYHISIARRGGLPAYRPMKKSNIKKRSPTRLYHDVRDDIMKEIVYPEDLWYTDVFPDDTVEECIHNVIEYLPDWTRIVIESSEQ